MCSLLTFALQLLDSPMQLPMAFPHGCSKLGLCLGNTVPQASDFIIRHVFHEKRGNISAEHLRSPRRDSNYQLRSYDECVRLRFLGYVRTTGSVAVRSLACRGPPPTPVAAFSRIS